MMHSLLFSVVSSRVMLCCVIMVASIQFHQSMNKVLYKVFLFYAADSDQPRYLLHAQWMDE